MKYYPKKTSSPKIFLITKYVFFSAKQKEEKNLQRFFIFFRELTTLFEKFPFQ